MHFLYILRIFYWRTLPFCLLRLSWGEEHPAMVTPLHSDARHIFLWVEPLSLPLTLSQRPYLTKKRTTRHWASLKPMWPATSASLSPNVVCFCHLPGLWRDQLQYQRQRVQERWDARIQQLLHCGHCALYCFGRPSFILSKLLMARLVRLLKSSRSLGALDYSWDPAKEAVYSRAHVSASSTAHFSWHIAGQMQTNS